MESFCRYESKYIITRQQQQRLLTRMTPYMVADRHGVSTIRNLYADTPDYRLIRRSLEKPVYKEKLRLRTYGAVRSGDTIFVELKKKYKGVVYKRRMELPCVTAMDWLFHGGDPGTDSQIRREMDAFCAHYGTLRPAVYLSYRRQAWFLREDRDFRVTFDEEILARCDGLSLTLPPEGTALLNEGKVLMELKSRGGMPLWLAEFLNEEEIRKTSFSKYGTAYQTMIYPVIKERFFNGNTVQRNF